MPQGPGGEHAPLRVARGAAAGPGQVGGGAGGLLRVPGVGRGAAARTQRTPAAPAAGPARLVFHVYTHASHTWNGNSIRPGAAAAARVHSVQHVRGAGAGRGRAACHEAACRGGTRQGARPGWAWHVALPGTLTLPALCPCPLHAFNVRRRVCAACYGGYPSPHLSVRGDRFHCPGGPRGRVP